MYIKKTHTHDIIILSPLLNIMCIIYMYANTGDGGGGGGGAGVASGTDGQIVHQHYDEIKKAQQRLDKLKIAKRKSNKYDD